MGFLSMINLPYSEIVSKIVEGASLAEDDVEAKIKEKMDQLSGLISKEGAAYIVANDLGIKLVKAEGALKVKEIYAGMKNIETVAKVMRKFPINEFERNGSKGKVGSFFVADETGQIRITTWHEQTDYMAKFEANDIIKITGAYARENNGQIEVHLNSSSKIEINPEGVEINVQVPAAGVSAQQAEATRKKISELQANDQNIEILGTVVQAFDPRFYPICPQCGKKATQGGDGFTCAEHGAVEPNYGYVFNIVVDDGSDNMRMVFFRNTVLDLIKKTDSDMQEYKESPEKFEEVKNSLLGETVKVVGRVTKNEMFDRLEFMANRVSSEVVPEEEMKRINSEKEVIESESKDEGVPSIDDL